MELRDSTEWSARPAIPAAAADSHRWMPYIVLAIMFVGYGLSYMDRQVISILLIPIRTEFKLSDGVAGLLVGPAFGLFYTLTGLPLSSVADRSNRRNLYAVCMAAWSLMTALCGAAQAAWQLMLFRFGVGAAEGGAQPAAVSIVADVFPPEKRSTVMAIYQTGGVLGIALGLPAAAWLATQYGWRAAFLLVGLPGLLLTGVLLLVVREPARLTAHTAASAEIPSLMKTIAALWARRDTRFFFMAVAANAGMASVVQWLPSFYERTYGIGLTEIGSIIILMVGGGGVGMVAGGFLVDRLGKGDPIWALKYMVMLPVISGPIGLAGLFAPDTDVSVVLLTIWFFMTAGWAGNAYAMTQTLVDPSMRARSVAVFGVCANLIGSGGGPALAGFVSQATMPYVGNDSLRWALSIIVCLGFVAAALYIPAVRAMRAGQTIRPGRAAV